jgi:hypothetical protein
VSSSSDSEMVESEHKCEFSRSAFDLLLVERATAWLLGEGE